MPKHPTCFKLLILIWLSCTKPSRSLETIIKIPRSKTVQFRLPSKNSTSVSVALQPILCTICRQKNVKSAQKDSIMTHMIKLVRNTPASPRLTPQIFTLKARQSSNTKRSTKKLKKVIRPYWTAQSILLILMGPSVLLVPLKIQYFLCM